MALKISAFGLLIIAACLLFGGVYASSEINANLVGLGVLAVLSGGTALIGAISPLQRSQLLAVQPQQ